MTKAKQEKGFAWFPQKRKTQKSSLKNLLHFIVFEIYWETELKTESAHQKSNSTELIFSKAVV